MRFTAAVKAGRAFVLAASVVAVLPCGAAAQQVSGGVKAGLAMGDIPNVEQVLSIEGIQTAWRTGFAAGGFVLVHWQNGLGIQPEVLYTQKGVKVEGDGDAGQVRVKTDFIDVPLLARYTFGKGVRGYLFGGPSFNFKVSAKLKESLLGQSDEEDISSDVETFEFALVVGGGIEFGPILFEARLSEGLTNINKPAPDEPSGDIKTRTYLFLAGIRF